MELQEERVQRLQDLQEIYAKDKQLEALASEVVRRLSSCLCFSGLNAMLTTDRLLLQRKQATFSMKSRRKMQNWLDSALRCGVVRSCCWFDPLASHYNGLSADAYEWMSTLQKAEKDFTETHRELEEVQISLMHCKRY